MHILLSCHISTTERANSTTCHKPTLSNTEGMLYGVIWYYVALQYLLPYTITRYQAMLHSIMATWRNVLLHLHTSTRKINRTDIKWSPGRQPALGCLSQLVPPLVLPALARPAVTFSMRWKTVTINKAQRLPPKIATGATESLWKALPCQLLNARRS